MLGGRRGGICGMDREDRRRDRLRGRQGLKDNRVRDSCICTSRKGSII